MTTPETRSTGTRRDAGRPLRVLHVIGEYTQHEAMARTLTEIARRLGGPHGPTDPGGRTVESHLVAATVTGLTPGMTSVHAIGGSAALFPYTRRNRLKAVVDRVRPDVVHMHGGWFTPLLANSPAFAGVPVVLSVYAAPTIPSAAEFAAVGAATLWRSNALRPRTIACSVLPDAALRAAARGRVAAILTPDPRVVDIFDTTGVPVTTYLPGANPTTHRAKFNQDAPVVMFLGRSEDVRGTRVLIDAFEKVAATHTTVRLRLLLLPTAELAALEARAAFSPVSDRIDVITTPISDTAAELAGATVGAWPFLCDYTTSPPALAAVEGLAVGLPVIGTDVGCLRPVLKAGAVGAMVRPGDVDSLATEIAHLIGDEDRWTAASHAALDQAADADWSHLATAASDAYAQAAR